MADVGLGSDEGHRYLGAYLAVVPFHGDPGIGRRKVKSLAVRDERHLVALAGLFLHFVSCRHTADPCTHDYRMRRDDPSV